MQITEHIHALRIPFQVLTPNGPIDRFVYVYLLVGETVTLVDSGVAGSEALIFDYLGSIGRTPRDIKRLFLTHSHPDHIGAAAAVQRATGCTIYAHAGELAWIQNVDLQAKERPIPGFAQLVGGSVTVDVILNDGDHVDLDEQLTLAILHTPGHSDGSLSLWLEPDGALICGDALPSAGDFPIYTDVTASVTSIKKMQALKNIDYLLASWDEPRRGNDIQTRFENGLAYMQRIHNAVRKNADGPGENPLAFGQAVLQELNMPKLAANPLIVTSFMAHWRLRDIGEIV